MIGVSFEFILWDPCMPHECVCVCWGGVRCVTVLLIIYVKLAEHLCSTLVITWMATEIEVCRRILTFIEVWVINHPSSPYIFSGSQHQIKNYCPKCRSVWYINKLFLACLWIYLCLKDLENVFPDQFENHLVWNYLWRHGWGEKRK